MFQSIPRPSSHKVVIIDWDDTILPSSFVDRWQIDTYRDLPLHFQNLLAELARCAEKFLREASRHGEVIIITNSDDGWVKYSAEKYVPALVPVMEQYRVVSARTRYERFYPGQPLCWKAAAFAHEVNEIHESLKEDDSCGSMVGTDVSTDSSSEEENYSDTEDFGKPREIISIGDSNEERTAVRIVAKQLKSRPKSVMFLNSPTPYQLIGQMHMLTLNMKYVGDQARSLDLEVTPSQAAQFAKSYMDMNKLDFEERAKDYMQRHLVVEASA